MILSKHQQLCLPREKWLSLNPSRKRRLCEDRHVLMPKRKTLTSGATRT